jgi:type I restriction enzyme S subunit
MQTMMVGSTQVHIRNGDFFQTPFCVPSLKEQTKIATFLTVVDQKITLLTQKADLLSQYKKGVMQQIFSQELRFKDDDGQEFPEWEEKTLGDVADITTGNSNRIDSTIGDGAYTFFDRSQDIRTSDIYLFDCEAVIVAGEGQEFIPKHFIGKFDLHQRTYAIIKFKSASGKYLFYYIHNFRYYFLSQAVGSTVKSLRLPMFQQMPIQLPSLPEQTKIANFLTAIDEKITNNQNQLNAVKQYKQGLLQQMFV